MSGKKTYDVVFDGTTFHVEERGNSYTVKIDFVEEAGFKVTWGETYPRAFFTLEKAAADIQRYVNEWGLHRCDYEEESGYDLYFISETSANNKGFKESFAYCRDYIRHGNGTNESYFEDYKGGIVQVICNETDEVVYEEEVR